jgi:hypothetical protein
MSPRVFRERTTKQLEGKLYLLGVRGSELQLRQRVLGYDWASAPEESPRPGFFLSPCLNSV